MRHDICFPTYYLRSISIVKGAPGLDANVKCKGLLGPDIHAKRVEDRKKDKETDINVQGLRPELLGVLCDVCIIHPITARSGKSRGD